LFGMAMLAFHVHTGEGSWLTTGTHNDIIRTPSDVWSFINVHGFVSSPDTWIGVAVGTALIAGAIELRRRRSEI